MMILFRMMFVLFLINSFLHTQGNRSFEKYCSHGSQDSTSEILCLATGRNGPFAEPGVCFVDFNSNCSLSVVAFRSMTKVREHELSFVRFAVTARRVQKFITYIELYVTQDPIESLCRNVTSINFARAVVYPNNTIQLYSIISEFDQERLGYTKDYFLASQDYPTKSFEPRLGSSYVSDHSTEFIFDVGYSSFLWKDGMRFHFNRPAYIYAMYYYRDPRREDYYYWDYLATNDSFVLLNDTRAGSTSKPGFNQHYNILPAYMRKPWPPSSIPRVDYNWKLTIVITSMSLVFVVIALIGLSFLVVSLVKRKMTEKQHRLELSTWKTIQTVASEYEEAKDTNNT